MNNWKKFLTALKTIVVFLKMVRKLIKLIEEIFY